MLGIVALIVAAAVTAVLLWPRSQRNASALRPTTSATSSPAISASASASASAAASAAGVATASAQPTQISPVPVPADSSVDCAKVACVALTFDDGPNPETTPALLNELQSMGVHATFFLIGQKAAANPQLVAAESAQGNVTGDHTWSHPDLTHMDRIGAAGQLQQAAQTIQQSTGYGPYLVRPPYGAWNDDTRTVVSNLPAAIVLWSVDSEDWRSRNTADIVNTVLHQARPGAIVIFHDIYPTTVAAIPQIITGLRAQGLTPVTVPTLLGGNIAPGWVYYSQHDVIRLGQTAQTAN